VVPSLGGMIRQENALWAGRPPSLTPEQQKEATSLARARRYTARIGEELQRRGIYNPRLTIIMACGHF